MSKKTVTIEIPEEVLEEVFVVLFNGIMNRSSVGIARMICNSRLSMTPEEVEKKVEEIRLEDGETIGEFSEFLETIANKVREIRLRNSGEMTITE